MYEQKFEVPIETFEKFADSIALFSCTNGTISDLKVDQWVNDLCRHYYELGKKHAFNESMQTPALFQSKSK